MTDIPVTKNGGNKIPMTTRDVEEYIGNLESLTIFPHFSDW